MSVSVPSRPRERAWLIREAVRAIRGTDGLEPDWRRDALPVRVVVAFVGLYLLLAELSGQLSTVEDVSPWYPPVGLSLAAVLVFGVRAIPMIFVADALQLIARGQEPLGQALVLGAAQAAFWGGTGLLLRPRLLAFSPLSRIRELTWFAVLGVAAGPIVAAGIGVALDTALDGDPWSEYVSAVRVYGIGDAIGVLSVTPSILVISGWARRPGPAWRAVRQAVVGGVDGIPMIVATVVVPVIAVSVADGDLLPVAPLPLAWVALRRGMPTTAFGVLVWSVSAVVAYAAMGDAISLRAVSALMISTGLLSLAVAAVVTERERGRARMAYLALHDDLTGLPNGRAFRARIDDAVTGPRRSELAVLHVRLALFDDPPLPAPAVVDQLLLRAAHRLRRLTGPDVTLACVGLGRFVAMLDGPDGLTPDDVAAQLVAGLERPARIDGGEYLLCPRVGVAVGAAAAATAEAVTDVLDRAERAAGGARSTAAFDDSMQQAANAERALGDALAKALDRDGLELHYQPIVNAFDRRPIGAEALLRWNDPDLGPVGPNVFIPVAETCGLILPIGRWVLREACCAAVSWPDLGTAPPVVHVNLSPVQLRDDGIADFVDTTLRETGLPPERLCLELTESALFHDLDVAAARVLELAELGVAVVLDDFGTGASSLSWLQRLPVVALKVDRSFVAGACDRPVDRAIVTATLGLAQAIALDTVAEGVETEEQASLLRDMGCGSLQGYLICRPVSGRAFAEWLEAAVRP